MSSPSPLHRLTTQHFDERYKHKQSESFLSQAEHTIWVSRHRTWRTQYLNFIFFPLKAVYNSCMLQGLLQVAKFLLMYSFTLINIVFLFRHLPTTEIVIFINFCYQISVVIVFPFLGAYFSNIPPTLFISCEVQTRCSKASKCSEQYIRAYLSGTKVRIWICSGYDAAFNFSCIALCSLTKPLTLFYIIFIIRIIP